MLQSTSIDFLIRIKNAYKAGKDLLKQNVAIAQTYEAVTKNELVRNVSNTYYNWVFSWQQYNLLLQTDSIFADYEKFATKKYNVGESNKLEKINATLQRKDFCMFALLLEVTVQAFLRQLSS